MRVSRPSELTKHSEQPEVNLNTGIKYVRLIAVAAVRHHRPEIRQSQSGVDQTKTDTLMLASLLISVRIWHQSELLPFILELP